MDVKGDIASFLYICRSPPNSQRFGSYAPTKLEQKQEICSKTCRMTFTHLNLNSRCFADLIEVKFGEHEVDIWSFDSIYGTPHLDPGKYSLFCV